VSSSKCNLHCFCDKCEEALLDSATLLSFLEFVTASVDAKQCVDSIYLDFAKAFDKVPHQRLLLKLKAHGINGAVCEWIEAWLKNRWQSVCLVQAGEKFAVVCFKAPCSAPFCSWFLPMTLKMVHRVVCLNLEMIPRCPVSHLWGWSEWVAERLGRGLQVGYSLANGIQCTIKCKSMRYGRSNTDANSSYTMYKKPIEEVSSEKDLGVVFSRDLKVALHCKECYSKANKMLERIISALEVLTTMRYMNLHLTFDISRTIKYSHRLILLNLYNSLSGHTWIIVHLSGTHTTAKIKSYLRGFSIVSLDCFRNCEDCHMMKASTAESVVSRGTTQQSVSYWNVQNVQGFHSCSMDEFFL